ncbi:hypothetical protein EI94DRAFT_718570 [Lactarius quietus]|nr:hypothetical protein EI94DRAFT_718570 [Lactarius quietus]
MPDSYTATVTPPSTTYDANRSDRRNARTATGCDYCGVALPPCSSMEKKPARNGNEYTHDDLPARHVHVMWTFDPRPNVRGVHDMYLASREEPKEEWLTPSKTKRQHLHATPHHAYFFLFVFFWEDLIDDISALHSTARFCASVPLRRSVFSRLQQGRWNVVRGAW